MAQKESGIEQSLLNKLEDLKYTYRPDIRDKATLEQNFRQRFEALNRVLNDTKPYGNILDFRAQESSVDEAIALFSGEEASRSREIWLVDPAPEVLEQFDAAVRQLESFMQIQGEPCTPEAVNNLKGDAARAEFINRFKEVQRLKTQLPESETSFSAHRYPREYQSNFRGF